MSSTRLLLAALLLAATPLAAQTPPFSGIPTDASISKRSGEKSPTTARIIGIIPGAGHMYAGEPKQGFGYLGAVTGLLLVGTILRVGDCVGVVYTGDSSCDGQAGAVAMVAAGGLWGWSLYDAGRAAQRTNAKRGVASVILEPIQLPIGGRRDRAGVRLGVSIATR